MALLTKEGQIDVVTPGHRKIDGGNRGKKKNGVAEVKERRKAGCGTVRENEECGPGLARAE